MITLLGFYYRKPGTTHEAFSHHWREVHGRLLRETPEIARYIRRYVQHNLSPNTAFPNLAPLEFDGFSETWFDSAETRKQMWAEPLFQKLVAPDEALFLDMERTRYSMVDRQVVQIEGDPALTRFSAA